ncbi:3-keto-disaccharide hydrolase [Allosphingosinicella deserti]|uniref:DUF1080 domain-containing protein n=1 Tax=Allosphingosinicella deserti TaxID=2116704 RepID=A0A2P7QNE9_9SPHN|nr:DUF1080 domain-containing protein [Sphingomonas deserti]PSJ39493.1 DUF1080 domain-containing protein [Sphingomonas deserti]
MIIAAALVLLAQAPAASAPAADPAKPRPEDTEQWKPVPETVRPGPAVEIAPPSDAIVLLGSAGLGEWASVKDGTAAQWLFDKGVMTVKKGTGNIQTKRSFTNYQLHLEWRIPTGITGSGQARGNSGLFVASTGGGDAGYELQILDSYENETYVNGQAGSVYKQLAPLANAMRKPGEWQSYDIVWTAPTFGADGALKSPARLTAFHNGVLIQDNVVLRGETTYVGQPQYKAHGPSPIKLQDHGDPSAPISFRNIWIREL